MDNFKSLDWDDLKVFIHAARGGSLCGRLRSFVGERSHRFALLHVS